MISRQSVAGAHNAGGRIRRTLTLALIGAALALVAAMAAAPCAHAAAKGIVDSRLEYHGGIDLAPVGAYVEEMGPTGLNARWTRVLAYWDQLQPHAPGVADPGDADGDGFNDAYVQELDAVVSALRAQGISVILTGSDPPAWARDTAYKKYWTRNSSTAVVRVGDSAVRSAFQGYARFLASHFKGFGIRHFEVWNEPNLRLIPQIVGGKVVGPEVYRKMLVSFSRGAHAGNPQAVVIAGATSRTGSNGTSTGSTSPQWFAKYLKRRGAIQWFDAYSHHPYSTRMSAPQPSAMPRRPDISVTLGNLTVLLKLFPTKPFYLTEYCYSTSRNDAFVLAVSRVEQARYMRQAFRILATRSYRQVKALLWFLVRDWQTVPGDDSSIGVYTGLIDSKGARKPSWWAFAGGNRITVTAPASTRARTRFRVSGTVTTREGALSGKTMTLERRGLKAKSWVTAKTARTKADGSYAFSVYQNRATRYRVVWRGVLESASVTVRLAR